MHLVRGSVTPGFQKNMKPSIPCMGRGCPTYTEQNVKYHSTVSLINHVYSLHHWQYKEWQLSYQSSGSVNKINYSLFLFGHHRDVAVSDDQPKSRPLRECSLRVHLRLSSGWVPANSRLYEKARVSTGYSANITLNHEALRFSWLQALLLVGFILLAAIY